MTQIEVSALLFRAASEFQSREETRYYLNGVYVTPHPEGGALMVATDGHRMLVAHDNEGVCKKAAIVSSEAATFKLMGKEPDVKLSVDGDGIATCGSYRSQKTTFIDGIFPDWARVVKPIVELAKTRYHGKPVFATASFNAQYLADFQKVHKYIGNGSSAVRVAAFTEVDPALVLFPSFPHVFGVLMPIRAACEPAVPAFMKAVFEPATVTKIAPKKPAAKTKQKAKTRKAA